MVAKEFRGRFVYTALSEANMLMCLHHTLAHVLVSWRLWTTFFCHAQARVTACSMILVSDTSLAHATAIICFALLLDCCSHVRPHSCQAPGLIFLACFPASNKTQSCTYIASSASELHHVSHKPDNVESQLCAYDTAQPLFAVVLCTKTSA